MISTATNKIIPFAKNKQIVTTVWLAILFLLIGSSTSRATTVYMQSTYLSVNLNNKSVKEVFKEIEENSEYVFFYYDGVIDVNRRVSINIKDQTVDKILDKLFESTNNTYTIDDRQIFITQKEKQSIAEAKVVVPQQQSKTITGTVKDNTQESLIGVSVKVKGTTSGTVTNLDGIFTLSTTEINPILVVSYIGYKPQEIRVGNQQHINIILEPDALGLEEVVVVGYGVQKKANLSGSVAAISSGELSDRPTANVSQRLQGQVANLNIASSSGRPNQAQSINIRGLGSITSGSGEPLILVDNIPVTSTEFMSINPDDVDNISILKDASSAAIYGARAAFGVILVTTKKATTNKVQVNFSGNVAFQVRGKQPEIETDPYLSLSTRKMFVNYDMTGYDQLILDYMKKREEDPSLPAVGIDEVNNRYLYADNINWFEKVFKKSSPAYTANINISQNTDKVNFYVSGGYYKQEGQLNYGSESLDRYNMRIKGDVKVTDRWTVGSNIAYTNKEYTSPSIVDNSYSGGLFWAVNRTHSFIPAQNPDGSWTKEGSDIVGYLTEGGKRKRKMNETLISLNTKFDIIKNVWSISADANFRRFNEKIDATLLRVMYRERPLSELTYRTNRSTDAAYVDNYNRDYDTYNIYTNFNKVFANKHSLGITAGYNQESERYDRVYTKAETFLTESNPELGLATENIYREQKVQELGIAGIFGRVNYMFDNKYILEMNGRYDGSSRFQKGNRWLFSPSVSAAWVIMNESFFESAAESIKMSNLKLRTSYGKLGNQALTEYYPTYPIYGFKKEGLVLDGEQRYRITPPGAINPNFTWESIRTVNTGVDLGFFNNRLNASFDYYIRYTDDMLGPPKELPAVFGTNEPRLNSAKMRTNGWELTLSWADRIMVKDSPLHYSVKFMLADNISKITKYESSTNSIHDWYKGKRYGEIWGLTSDGFFQSEEELAALDQSDVGTDDQGYKFHVGDLKYKDLNGDDKITKGAGTLEDHGDYTVIGNTSPRFPFGLELNGSWKGFDIRAFFQGIAKRDFYFENGSIYFWGVYAQPWTNLTKKNLDHWTEDNRNAYFPRPKAYIAEDKNEEASIPQTKYLQNAAYLRLKNLTLGYTLPKSFNKLGISNCRVYFSADNLFTISKLDVDLDPEIIESYNGFGKNTYPLQKTYSFGINVTF